LWLHSLKVAQLLRSAACLHTNQSRSYLNHLVLFEVYGVVGDAFYYIIQYIGPEKKLHNSSINLCLTVGQKK